MPDTEENLATTLRWQPLCPLATKAAIGAARLSVTLMAAMSICAPAFAETAPLDAAYGNKDGCLYANTGESIGSDDFFLLTQEAITTAVSYCEFKSIDGKSNDGFAATVSCQEEGGEIGQDFKVDVSRSGKDSYTIVFADGNTWGPLKKCK